MNTIINPPYGAWENLCKRPMLSSIDLEEKIENILQRVQLEGESALKEFTLRFDKVLLESIQVSRAEMETAGMQIPQELIDAISVAAQNIRAFHQSQLHIETPVETMQSITCWRKTVAIENVGLYIPGGSAPLFSTLLMLGIPALIAGCSRIVVCTPPDKNGKINPTILYTASLLGVTEIFKVGGAQAIAAMAYGTEHIPKVDKIFGPGNQYVAKAKELVQKNGVAIDLPAGPSEVVVIANGNADPEFVASDLLAQAEHGEDSQVVLLTDNHDFVEKVNIALAGQLSLLPRAGIIAIVMKNSFAVVFNSIAECIDFSNFYAPEHLILALEQAEDYVNRIKNAGSVFLGKYACETAGDYASGTNHTLPTNGYARNYSGVSVDSFVKQITFQKISKEGLRNIGKTIEVMAEAEQLIAHKNAVSIRLNKIDDGQ